MNSHRILVPSLSRALGASTLCFALSAAAGCVPTPEPFDGSGGDRGQAGEPAVGGAGGSGASASEGGQGTSEGGAGSTEPEGPTVTIRFRSHTDPFDHDDGLSGQTPIEHLSGLRKLQLFTSPTDPSPVTIFDFGSDFVEVSYDDGADTAVYSLPASSLPSGTYTMARVVHSHVRYRVAGTMHANGWHLPGEFDNLQVLSDGTMLDGQLRNHGYYEYVFVTGNQEFPASGTNAPLPQGWDTGGFSVGFDDGEWSYSFPVELVVSPALAQDLAVVLEVNMFESFRWQDQELAGYQPGVLDSTPLASEPVIHFGANDFWLTVEG